MMVVGVDGRVLFGLSRLEQRYCASGTIKSPQVWNRSPRVHVQVGRCFFFF